jgi:nicotinamide riboside transporter PnuC
MIVVGLFAFATIGLIGVLRYLRAIKNREDPPWWSRWLLILSIIALLLLTFHHFS